MWASAALGLLLPAEAVLASLQAPIAPYQAEGIRFALFQRGAILAFASCRVPVGRSVNSESWALLSPDTPFVVRTGTEPKTVPAAGVMQAGNWLTCCQ